MGGKLAGKQAGGRKVRYAVVGLGHISQVAMLPAFAHAKNSKLVALVSGDAEKRRKLSKKYDIETAIDYDGFDELMASGDVDAVYIATPNHLHRDYTERAAKHGVHVLCEKPMAVTEEDCRAMIRACDEARVKLMIAYRLHFDKANLTAIETARKGKLGTLRLFTSTFGQNVSEGDIRLAPTDKGGGSLYDMGTYCINAARYLFAAEPTRVTAVTASRKDEDRFEGCDEIASAILEFPDQRIATFTSSFGIGKVTRYTLAGDAGSLTMSPAYEYAVPLELTVEREGKKPKHKSFDKRDQFAPQLLHFSECILEGSAPEPGGHEGLADVRIIEAIHRSARTGNPVDIAPVDIPSRPDMSQEITRPPVDKPDEVNASSPSD